MEKQKNEIKEKLLEKIKTMDIDKITAKYRAIETEKQKTELFKIDVKMVNNKLDKLISRMDHMNKKK